MFKKIKEFIKSFPLYGWIMGILMFGLQYGTYRLGHAVSIWIGTYSYAFAPKLEIDNYIKLIPVFAIPYLLSYVFWIFGPIVSSKGSKEGFANYMIGLSLAYVIGILFFIFMPTIMDRNVEGLINVANGNDFNSKLLKLIYSNDGTDIGFNLFPSFHCMISLYCYLGVHREKNIKKWYKIFALVCTVIICMSTVFTKQHYFIDILGGIALACICYTITYFWNPGRRYMQKHNITEDSINEIN